jgi:hypothetical protein
MRWRIWLLLFLLLPSVSFAAAQFTSGDRVLEGTFNACTSSGSTNVYACSLGALFTSYRTQSCYAFTADSANDGAAEPTVNFSGAGAKTIKKLAGGITTALAANDIRSGQIVQVCYDGTNMQMQSQPGNAASGTGDVVGPSASVDSEVALFNSTTGKLLKRATGSGLGLLTSGVLSTVAAPAGTVVGTTDTQTLANKNLTTPTIASFINATHTHADAAGGGQLTDAALSTQVTVAKGGTGRATLTNHGVLVGAGTTAITQLAAAAAGTVLTGQGASADPSFSATPTLGVAGTTLGTLAFAGNTSGTVTIQPAAAAGTWSMTLPTTAGTSGQFLQTNGSGVTTWATASGSGTVSTGSVGAPAYYAAANTTVGPSTAMKLDATSIVREVKNVTASSSSITAGDHNVIACDATGANRTYTLPAASGLTLGQTYRVIKIDSGSNTCIFAPASGERLNGVVDGTKSTAVQFEDIQVILVSTSTPNWQVSASVLSPLSVANGGSGAATLTGLLQGNGASAFTAITNSTTVGQVLRVTGSNAYGWGALDLAVAAAVTGVLPAANTPAFTGDVTKASTSATTVLANIPTAVPMAGYLAATAIAAPGTPAAGIGRIYVDSTSKNIAVKDDAGVVKHGVQTDTGASNNFLTAISDAGVISKAQPAFTNISGVCTVAQGCTGTGSTLTGLLLGNASAFTAVTSTTVSQVLRVTGSNTFAFGQLDLAAAAAVTVVLPAANLPTTTVNSVVNDTNVTGSISAQALTLGWTGTLAKARIIATAVYNDQANTWSTGAQDMGAATSFKVPTSAGAGPTANGLLAYDSTSNTLEVGVNTANTTVALTSALLPKTATYQVVVADFDAFKTIPVASGTFTITLPATATQPSAGKYIDVLNYGTGVVTVARTDTNLNGGTASLVIPASSATAPTHARIWSDGTNYFGSLDSVGSGGSGTVTSIATTSPITGGTITTTGTIACATCVTSAAALTNNQLVFGAGSQATAVGDLTGDVTTAGGKATTIAAGAVTLAKMANMATASLLGRTTAATGVPEVLSVATSQGLLGITQPPIRPYSAIPVTAGMVYGCLIDGDEMLCVANAAALTTNAIWRLGFEMPPTLATTCTYKLQLDMKANAATGVMRINPKWNTWAPGVTRTSLTLNAETVTPDSVTGAAGSGDTVTLGTGDANQLIRIKWTLNASTVTAAQRIAMDLTFETASTTLGVESGYLPSIICE